MGLGLSNSPIAGAWFIVDVLQHNSAWTIQIAYSFTQSSCPVYIRTQNEGTWLSWRLFNPGTANTAQVLTGYTFSSANGTNLSGTMANRGALNWNPGSSTSYSVPAGYYSGGTLNTANAYNAGVAAGKTSFGSWSVAFCQSTYGINGSIGSTIIGTRTLGQNGYVCAISLLDQTSESEGGVSISGGSSVLNYRTSYGNSWVRILANRVNSSTSFNVTNSYTGGARSLAIIVIYVKA